MACTSGGEGVAIQDALHPMSVATALLQPTMEMSHTDPLPAHSNDLGQPSKGLLLLTGDSAAILSP